MAWKYFHYVFDLTATLQDSPSAEILLRRIAEFISRLERDKDTSEEDKKYLENLGRELQARYFARE